jgi:hypothetical protein
MMNEKVYTADQVATAARELREAAGTDEELFSGEQVIAMLGEEIRLLRERGFTDDHIAELMSGFDIEVTGEQVTETSRLPA